MKSFLLPDWLCNIFTFKTDAPDEGLEPATLRLKVWCSTNWANRALWFHRSQGPTQPRTHQNNLFRQFKVSFCIHFSNIISNIHLMVRLNPKKTPKTCLKLIQNHHNHYHSYAKAPRLVTTMLWQTVLGQFLAQRNRRPIKLKAWMSPGHPRQWPVRTRSANRRKRRAKSEGCPPARRW